MNTCWCNAKYILLVPYPLAEGTLFSLLAVCLSVRHTWVFQTFLCHLLRYWLEIWYINCFWHNKIHAWVSLYSSNLYVSWCPLQKFNFPDFSVLSFNIFLVHLSRRLKCTIVIIRCPSSICLPSSVVVNFSLYRLLLMNEWNGI